MGILQLFDQEVNGGARFMFLEIKIPFKERAKTNSTLFGKILITDSVQHFIYRRIIFLVFVIFIIQMLPYLILQFNNIVMVVCFQILK